MTGTLRSRVSPYLLPGAMLALAVVLIATGVNRPAAVLDMWRPWGEIGALATVMTAIILTGGIDLSVGSTIALSSVSFGLLWQRGWPWEAAAAATLAVGLAAGAFNATLVALGIVPLVVTLATMALYGGMAMALSQGRRIAGLPEDFASLGQGSWLGAPNQLLLFLAAWIAAWLVVQHMRYGRYLYAIGENRLAAEFAAVPIRKVEFLLYTASGAMAALVALIYTARGGAAVPGAGAGLELQAIACVVVGGTRVTGGSGGLGRTLLGVTILSLLDIGLQFVSRKIHLPWSDVPVQLGSNARLILTGALVIALAIWNERSRAHHGSWATSEPPIR